MCRNILELRGLDPPATHEEVEAAARQFIRKVTGIREPNQRIKTSYEAAIADITSVTSDLLADLPRRQPPKTDPPLRRPEVRERLGLDPR